MTGMLGPFPKSTITQQPEQVIDGGAVLHQSAAGVHVIRIHHGSGPVWPRGCDRHALNDPTPG